MMTNDGQLLVCYVAQGSEEAFRELVRHHMGLVYSAALRQVRDPQLAQDVTQVVFANLARKARSIPAGTVLAGWLHRDTRYTALDFLRAEARRFRREQQAAAMHALNSEPPHYWEHIRPLLDEALDQLGPEDRDALLLRYFEERDYAGVGAALGASGEAARKRVDRALDRLRAHLVKRGITTTTAALGAALSAHAIEAVPASFATALVGTSAAVAAKAAAPAVTSWLTHLTLMTNTKLVVGGVLVAAALATPLLVQQQAIAKVRAEQTVLLVRQQQAAIQPESASPSAAQRAAGDSAQRDWADLERLRRETGALQARTSELAIQALLVAQARRPPATTPGHNPNSTPIGETVQLADARDVGQATPAALVQTFLWAAAQGDTNRLVQLFAGAAGTDAAAVQRAMAEWIPQIAAETAKGTNASMPAEIRLLEDQPAENNDRWILTEAVKADGTLDSRDLVRVHLTDTGWRMLIGTNGLPVSERLSDTQ
jgi:RNA polymerase sigma factor (sigma-70 family)